MSNLDDPEMSVVEWKRLYDRRKKRHRSWKAKQQQKARSCFCEKGVKK